MLQSAEKERFVENLLTVLPYWHCAIDKNVKRYLKDKMSLETYYCLQTIRGGGAMPMSELADRLRISRQQATQMVQKLYEHGFVRRLQSEADRRSVKIEVTPLAEAYIQDVYYQDNTLMEELQRRIGAENMAELARAVEILLRVLPKIEQETK